MQVPEIIRPPMISLPPMYTWPMLLKRIVLALAALACIAAYVLLVGGLIGVVFLFVNLSFG